MHAAMYKTINPKKHPLCPFRRKVEMLNLQAQTAQSSGAASEAPTIYRRDTSERVTAALPSYQIGASTTKPTQNEPVTGRAGRDRPVPRKEPRKGARKATSLAVDLKAELRAESEKAAAKASKRDSGRVEKSSQGVGLQNVQEPVERTRTARSEEREGGRTMPEVPSSLSATKASAGTAVAGRQGESIPSPTATAGLDDVTAAGRALLAGTTFQRAADQLQDVAGQVKTSRKETPKRYRRGLDIDFWGVSFRASLKMSKSQGIYLPE